MKGRVAGRQRLNDDIKSREPKALAKAVSLREVEVG